MYRDLTKGSIIRGLLLFALPMIAGNLLQQLYNIADTLIVGQALGRNALAAVGSAYTLMTFLTSIFLGLSMGSGALFSIALGKKDEARLRSAVGHAFGLILAVTVVLNVLVYAFLDAILRFLQIPQELYGQMREYLVIIFAGLLATFLYNFFACLLRAAGNSVAPLCFLGLSAGLNIALDLLFVLRFGWGIAGAAAATVIAQLISCLVCLWALRSLPIPRIEKSQWRPSAPLVRCLLILGAPLALQNTIIAVGGMVVQSVVNSFGVLFVAGYTATNKLYGLLEIAATSFGFSMATYTGQNLGAKRYDRIRSGIRTAALMAVAIALVITACMLLFGRPLLSLFLSGEQSVQDQVLAVAYRYLAIMSVMLFVLYLLHVYRSALQGMGDTIVPMLSGFIEMLMRIGSAVLLPAYVGQDGVFLAEVIAWTGAAVLLIVTFYIRTRGWRGRTG